MSLKREEKDKIKEFLLKTISIGENPYKAMENNFKISRQTVSKYLNELVEKNYITKNSKGNYAINFYISESKIYKNKNLEEDIVYAELIKKYEVDKKNNVKHILVYAFTEMLNNAIEHSEGTEISIYYTENYFNIFVTIKDNGIGIFRKIVRDHNLKNENEAIFELKKGKLTSDAENHSGEGIFFTSKVVDIFNNKKFALFEYVNGNSITKIDTHIIREIAMNLGKLHSFSKDFSFEEYNRKSRIDFDFYYNEIKKSEIDFRFKNELLSLVDKIDDFDFSNLPSGVIHGDIFPDNVLLDEYNNIKVIFDFNESYYAPFIFDIAIVINFWIKINDFDFFTENNLIRDFLNYYSKYRKITKEELKSLDIACKKIALTFIFLRIYKEKIENSYQKAISIQEKSYLDLIKLIKL